MIFSRSSCDNKSSQVFRTLLSILANLKYTVASNFQVFQSLYQDFEDCSELTRAQSAIEYTGQTASLQRSKTCSQRDISKLELFLYQTVLEI